MKYDIKNFIDDTVMFTADIDCEENASESIKLGKAVIWANLKGANLEGANLKDAYLAYAYLEGADLEGADLTGEIGID